MLCKHNDCGWCYASELSKTNAKQGQCFEYSKCPEYITLKDGWNIECSMEPVPTDAVAHANDEWSDELIKENRRPYLSAAEIPEDLKWLVDNIDECLGHCQKTLGGFVNCKYIKDTTGFSVETHLNANKIYTRTQWQCAKDLIDAVADAPSEWPDEYEQSQHSAEEVTGSQRTDVRMAINDTLKAIHEEQDVVIKIDLKVHLSFLLTREREELRSNNG